MASKRERYSYTRLMKELKAGGSASTADLYTRLGVTDDVWGVSYEFLKKLDKKVEPDHELAEKLWASGNHDARIFACWVAEPAKVTQKLLDTWARDVKQNVGLLIEVANLAAFCDLGAKCSRKWRKVKAETKSAMGWSILGSLAMQPDRALDEGGVTDEELTECLAEIEAKIHTAPNRTKSNMNQALIAIGCRSTMTKATLKVAKRVGAVEVDQGDRSCTTLVAYDRIKKTVDRYKAKGKKPTDGAGGKRRRHC